MAPPSSLFPIHYRYRRALSVGDAAATKRRHPDKAARPAALDGLLLHWTLKRLSVDLLLQKLNFRREAVSQLSRLCSQIAHKIAGGSVKSRCLPSTWAGTSRERFSKFPVGRLIETRYTGSLYRASAGIHDVLVYLKCSFSRGSVDAIRLLLHHKRVPHAEFHVDQSFKCQEIASQFEAAGLPATIPYYSDDHCEMTGSRTILKYLAAKTGLAGVSEEDAARVESTLDFCFAALHTIWGADCTCTYPRDLSKERARAHYCRDKILPILQTLCSLVRLHAANRADEGTDAWAPSDPPLNLRAKQCRWIVGEVTNWQNSHSKILQESIFSVFCGGHRHLLDSLLSHQASAFLSGLHSLAFTLFFREFGDSTTLPFTELRCFMERVEAHSRGIQLFCDSEARF
ncbi:hypothetical protein Esti_004567 [Eimeria stiedai]